MLGKLVIQTTSDFGRAGFDYYFKAGGDAVICSALA
jgi:hypothetical protein